MKIIQNLGNWALVGLLYVLVIIAFGAWWKFMKQLFCIGYGC